MRFDIVSDTHGYLSEDLLSELEGADVIVHAGDMCSLGDFLRLEEIAPVHMCLGNNDWGIDYGPFVERVTKFFSAGLRWQICHYEERLDLVVCDVAICGHTHRPFVRVDERNHTLVMNPGSPSLPRRGGPTIGRIYAERGQVQSAEIVELPALHRW